MMPSTPHRDNFRGADPIARRPRRRGFTLTEMLIVIGIIVLVLSIATPMVTRAWRTGDKTRMAADLQAIAGALEAYRQDHGSYPQVAPPPAPVAPDYNGARMLCRALIGPGPEIHEKAQYIPDGKGADITPPNPEAPGPGFRTRGTSGRVYGPYLKPESFKLGNPTTPGDSEHIPGFLALLDRYNKPILYYSSAGKPNIRLTTSYAWDRAAAARPLYNALDNWDGTRGAMPKEMLACMLGDTNANGQIDAASSGNPDEVPAHEGPYLLWSAGPDEVFGIARTSKSPDFKKPDEIRQGVEKSDDVTNFRN